jgi:catechol 2,3-dioxygenase-like lactoylglutathione lyase family enzyme
MHSRSDPQKPEVIGADQPSTSRRPAMSFRAPGGHNGREHHEMEDAMSEISGIGTVAIPVRDQDRALEFYLDELGFEKRRDVPFGDARWIEVAPPGATTTIALVPADGRIPTGIRLTTGDADADHAALRARGVDADPEVMRMGDVAPPMFALRDPDGNNLILVEV